MALIEIVRDVPLTQDAAWSRLTDWQRHGDFVPLTSIQVSPAGFVAHTGLGPLGFDDPMEIVASEPPSFCRLEKRGRVVTGWAEIRVSPLGDLTRIVWREDIHVTGMPRFADGLARASSRKLFGKVIDGLLATAG
ncbi:SRPBCC family protein [Aeromicrobium sp.]